MRPNPKPPLIDDKAYRDSFRGRPCEVCGIQDDTIIPAHVDYNRAKVKTDDLCVALCFECHSQQHRDGSPGWWVQMVLEPIIRQRYWDWKHDRY